MITMSELDYNILMNELTACNRALEVTLRTIGKSSHTIDNVFVYLAEGDGVGIYFIDEYGVRLDPVDYAMAYDMSQPKPIRQKRLNTHFTYLYPGYLPGIGTPAKNSPYVAITNSGEFVSVCTEEGCAVFYSARDLRLMAAVLNEAADIFEANQAKARQE